MTYLFNQFPKGKPNHYTVSFTKNDKEISIDLVANSTLGAAIHGLTLESYSICNGVPRSDIIITVKEEGKLFEVTVPVVMGVKRKLTWKLVRVEKKLRPK